MRIINSIACHFQRFQTFAINRMVPSSVIEKDNLSYWRVRILFAIIFTGLFIGLFTFVPLVAMVVKENLWGLLIVDGTVWLSGIGLLLIRGLRYDIRAGIALLIVYFMGLFIIISVGPLSGGPAWLFSFAVLVGILLGVKTAIIALIVNAITITFFGWIITAGLFGQAFPFFDSTEKMITAGASFMLLNTIVAMSVAVLVKGLISAHQKEKDLTSTLKIKESRLIKMNNKLESEVEERKKAEVALLESETRFRGLVETSSDWIWEVNVEGIYTYASPQVEEILGYKPDEIIGKTTFELMPPDEADRIAGIFKELIETGEPIIMLENVCLHKDGRHIVLEKSGVPVLDAAGKIIGHRGVDRDITVRKQAVEALRESEEIFRDLVENIDEVIYTLDKSGQITYVSPAIESKGGYNQKELIGRSLSEVVYHEDLPRLMEQFQKILSGYLQTNEYRLVAKSGEIYWVRASSRPIYKGNRLVGLRGVISDITESKRLQTELRQSQKMEAIGILAGGIAHDFNNLLQTIYGFTEMLLRKKDPSDPDYKWLKQIDRTAQRAGELTEQLLIFSRRVESKLQPTELNRQVEQVSKLLERTIPKMISLEFRPAENLNVINADQGQIEQILMNLGINARDALPEGGRLLFETENVTLDKQYCQAHPGAVPGEYVMLSVSDTGCGMGKDILEHIFEPFYTTKEIGKGTGLGLAMVYGIVKSHDGYITCDSEPGQGTTFKIYFPVFMTESPVPKKIERKEVELSGGSETILVVDDEPTLLQAVRLILKSYGYKAIFAESGERAIEIFEKQKDFIDLVILDVGMPGMGGFKCLERLLEIDSTAKVIIASGYAPDENIKEVIETCGVVFIRKPYRRKDILGEIREVLDKE